MFLIVFTLWVISSPVTPSPLVAPRTNLPFLYSNETDKPSIFNSQTYLGFGTSFFTLSSNAIISLSLNTLLSDNIGTSWVTLLNPSITSPPTRTVGESGLLNSGYFSSKLINSLK